VMQSDMYMFTIKRKVSSFLFFLFWKMNEAINVN
jgi:hypothetical protein